MTEGRRTREERSMMVRKCVRGLFSDGERETVEIAPAGKKIFAVFNRKKVIILGTHMISVLQTRI